ncbi:MAG TPA: hypothetical protein VEH27_01560 [Methylomirabilota bacterium]|nr:hypothetical protein [Methylomirabilota bacterium]
MPEKVLSIRTNRANSDHHIWNNNGTYWCHFTVHLPDFTKERVRVSLETRNITEARQRRDSLLALFGGSVGSTRGELAAVALQA